MRWIRPKPGPATGRRPLPGPAGRQRPSPRAARSVRCRRREGRGRPRQDLPAAAPPPVPCAAGPGSDRSASSATGRNRSASTTCGSPASDGTGRDDSTRHPIALARPGGLGPQRGLADARLTRDDQQPGCHGARNLSQPSVDARQLAFPAEYRRPAPLHAGYRMRSARSATANGPCPVRQDLTLTRREAVDRDRHVSIGEFARHGRVSVRMLRHTTRSACSGLPASIRSAGTAS